MCKTPAYHHSARKQVTGRIFKGTIIHAAVIYQSDNQISLNLLNSLTFCSILGKLNWLKKSVKLRRQNFMPIRDPVTNAGFAAMRANGWQRFDSHDASKKSIDASELGCPFVLSMFYQKHPVQKYTRNSSMHGSKYNYIAIRPLCLKKGTFYPEKCHSIRVFMTW